MHVDARTSNTLMKTHTHLPWRKLLGSAHIGAAPDVYERATQDRSENDENSTDSTGEVILIVIYSLQNKHPENYKKTIEKLRQKIWEGETWKERNEDKTLAKRQFRM